MAADLRCEVSATHRERPPLAVANCTLIARPGVELACFLGQLEAFSCEAWHDLLVTSGRPSHGVTPDWWRGTTPQRLPTYASTPVRGEVREFDSSSLPVNEHSLLRGVFFDQAHGSGLEVVLDDLGLTVCWSEFDGCTFRQRSRRLNAKGIAAQGSFGNRPSIYRDCTFTGIRFKQLGGFTAGAARFVNCRFERCTFNGHFSRDADYIDCTFAGKIDGGGWYGTAPSGAAYEGRRNVITGNDFTGVTFGANVGWRGDFDFAAQRWPHGYPPVPDGPGQDPSRGQ